MQFQFHLYLLTIGTVKYDKNNVILLKPFLKSLFQIKINMKFNVDLLILLMFLKHTTYIYSRKSIKKYIMYK